jgi:tetratricopeptide (TPR) repeat protein
MTLRKRVVRTAQPGAPLERNLAVANKSSADQWWHYFIPPILLSVVTAIVYYPSLVYPFQFDDLANISKKFDIRFLDWKTHLFGYSRWVGELLNRITYQVGEYFRFGGGGFDPYYYRVINTGIHIATGMLVLAFVYRLLSRLTDDSFLKNNALKIASLTSALFLLHPVQTQTVSYIIQARLEGMATFFTLIALLLMVVGMQARSMLTSVAAYALAGFVAFVSCGTKEIVVVLPFLGVLVDLFFVARGDVKKVFKRAALHAIIGVIIFVTLAKFLNVGFFKKVLSMSEVVSNNRGNILNGGHANAITAWHFLISEFKVILHYLTIFFVPLGLSVEYDWKMVNGFFAPDCIFPLLGLLALGGYAIYRWTQDSKSLYSFSLAWFFIAVAPRSTILPSPELVCDYKTYLASIGVFFWMAVMLVHLYDYAYENDFFALFPSSRQMQTSVLSLACVVGLGYAAHQRNLVWETPVSLWLDIVEKAPLKARGQNNLGVALSEAGRYEEAIPHFIQAVKLDKQYSDPWSNIAVCYSVKGNDDSAIQALREAIRLNPEYAEAQNNLGSLLIKKGEFVAAEGSLKNAVLIRPHYGKAWFNLGRLYLEQKKHDEAWQAFLNATKGDLDNANVFNIVGQVGLQIGKYEGAVVAFQEALKRANGVEDANVEFNLANGYFLTNRYSEARQIFNKLALKHPEEHRFGYNLAETMFMQGDFSQAQPLFASIAKKTDTLPNAPMRAAQCLEKSGLLKEAAEYVGTMLASSASEQTKHVLQQEKKRLEFAAHLQASGGVVTAQDMQRLLGDSLVQTTEQVT